jgi:nucleoid DNA-binding protein
MPKLELLPDIDSYLDYKDSEKLSVSNSEIVSQIQIHTGLSYEVSKIILNSFFKEIQTSLLKGNCVQLTNFGKMMIISNNIGYYVKFKPSKTFKRALNECK